MATHTPALADSPQDSKPGRALRMVSVKSLVEWVHRTGDLYGVGGFRSINRAQQGSKAHREIQNSSPARYRSEVYLETSIESVTVSLKISGRLDGLFEENDQLILEEIKSTFQILTPHAEPLHVAQAKIYAHLLYLKEKAVVNRIRMTYVHLIDDQVTTFQISVTSEEIQAFFERTVHAYLNWIEKDEAFIRRRNESIQTLTFPHSDYRKGQRRLAVEVYKGILAGERLMIQAPTGIGKTLGLLFPALKSMPHGGAAKIIYLTARVITRNEVENNLKKLVDQGLQIRSLTLSTRERLCRIDGREPCDPRHCLWAKGFYEHFKPALEELLEVPLITPHVLAVIGKKHQVCPYGLAREASVWVDLVVGDYNHIFDPFSSLMNQEAFKGRNRVLLIDEAHNLVDRARTLFGTFLTSGTFSDLAKGLSKPFKAIRRSSLKIAQVLNTLSGEASETEAVEFPDELGGACDQFQAAAETWLVQDQPSPFNEDLKELYFSVHRFLKLKDWLGSSGELTCNDTGDGQLTLSCLDPGPFLKSFLDDFAAVFWFSATLHPFSYFNDLLAGGTCDRFLQLPYPFNPEHIRIHVDARFALTFKQRNDWIEQVAESLCRFFESQPGNHLVYFSSFDYLNKITAAHCLKRISSDIDMAIQTREMTAEGREAFLEGFKKESVKQRVGFAVLGGVFGEGIDLPGNQLQAVSIVGVGLPQINRLKDRERAYFDGLGRNGFDYAYRIPGMSKVIQAAGRLIRSESDVGALLLVDRRFLESTTKSLLPPWWPQPKLFHPTP